MTGGILVVDDEGVVVAAKVGGDAINLADIDTPAADGRADDLQLAA